MKPFKRGDTFTEGIDIIIKRDLDKHKSLLEKNIIDILAMQNAIAAEIARKNYYGEQKGNRKYKDDAMDTAITQMTKNINGYSVRIKIVEEERVLNTRIVDTLTLQLQEYYEGLKQLSNIRKLELDANGT